MPSLSFTVQPSDVGRLHGLLSCLAKFDENISLEAGIRGLRISTINSSKSAYACFILGIDSFLVDYTFRPDQVSSVRRAQETWGCTLQNRALLSIFKKRYTDTKDKELAIERCEFQLHDRADTTKCRLIVRLFCRQCMVKTYKLTYEQANVLSANFDTATSPNRWITPARTLRDVAEYFGAKADHLDWVFDGGKINFVSYTEKVTDGKDIFKQPMQTCVAIERKDFSDFSVQEGLRIGILVRDFRAIVAHAEGLGVDITARYSTGNKPMQIVYEDEGMSAEFTLMTRNKVGDSSYGNPPTNPSIRHLSVRPAGSQQSQRTPQRTPQRYEHQQAGEQTPAPVMAPPAAVGGLPDARTKATSRRSGQGATNDLRPFRTGSPPAPSATLDHHSLFFPAGEEEHFWDEHDNETAERDDFITWDVSGRGTGLSESNRLIRDSEASTAAAVRRPLQRDVPIVQEIAPTQRLSQLKGLFD